MSGNLWEHRHLRDIGHGPDVGAEAQTGGGADAGAPSSLAWGVAFSVLLARVASELAQASFVHEMDGPRDAGSSPDTGSEVAQRGFRR